MLDHLWMSFFAFAAGVIGKLAISVSGRSLSEAIKDFRTQRRMERMVEDAVDRIVEQLDAYLTSEGVSEHRKEVLITALSAKLQPLADDPQRFFAGNLDGTLIFKQCHPDGELFWTVPSFSNNATLMGNCLKKSARKTLV